MHSVSHLWSKYLIKDIIYISRIYKYVLLFFFYFFLFLSFFHSFIHTYIFQFFSTFCLCNIIFQVCELDIIFNFEKAYFILDEFLMGGEIQETSKQSIAKSVEASDMLQEVN